MMSENSIPLEASRLEPSQRRRKRFELRRLRFANFAMIYNDCVELD